MIEYIKVYIIILFIIKRYTNKLLRKKKKNGIKIELNIYYYYYYITQIFVYFYHTDMSNSERVESVETSAKVSHEARAFYYAFFDEFFGPSRTTIRSHMRGLRDKLPEELKEIINKLLLLIKQYDFSLIAHENLYSQCLKFYKEIPDFNITTNIVDKFYEILDAWQTVGITSSDSAIISRNKETFKFLDKKEDEVHLK
jgi:hypothetical protein